MNNKTKKQMPNYTAHNRGLYKANKALKKDFGSKTNLIPILKSNWRLKFFLLNKITTHNLLPSALCLKLIISLFSRNGIITRCSIPDDKGITVSKSTITKFFKQQPIRKSCFERICNELMLNWQDIAELEDYTTSRKLTDYTLYELLMRMENKH